MEPAEDRAADDGTLSGHRLRHWRLAVATGSGVTLAVAHTISNQLESGTLSRINVAGTPAKGIWYASSLIGNPLPAAQALRRFMTTPEATHATLGGGGVPPRRLHPPVHVTLWSSISGPNRAKKG